MEVLALLISFLVGVAFGTTLTCMMVASGRDKREGE